MRRTTLHFVLICGFAGVLGSVGACADDGGGRDTSDTLPTIGTLPDNTDDTSGDGDGDDEPGCPPAGCLDIGENTGNGPGCASGDGTCNQVDLLFIIDNSGTMGEEQVNLSANFPLLIDKLQMLTDKEGELLNPDVHIMVTTTDVGHPQCSQFEIPGYDPAVGSPQATACSERLEYFTGLGSNPPSFPEACVCPVPIVPNGDFIEFSGEMGAQTNVPGDDVKGALSCIGPQGIVGCGYEAPLEAMLQSIYSGAPWNTADKPFLRDEAILAIAIITDEADCSVRSPDGYAYFTDANMNTYWEVNPDTGTKTQATSAVCWNAGVDCGLADGNGVYGDCMSTDTGVLHPLSRYSNYLQNELIDEANKEVIMLGILGVPPVTAHNPNAPFEPTAGGVESLVYREWRDGAYPGGDILPDDLADSDAATKEFEFGVGPGCTGEDGMGGFTGQAIPPVRVKEVCEALNDGDKIRCCIESICDTDFSDALGCLTGIIQTVVDPPE